MMGKKTQSRHRRANRSGVSLVELLVVILISVFVVAVAFTLYRVNVTYYLKKDASLEQDQNLRMAMATVARDVRMAGNGFAILGQANVLQFIQIYVPGQEKLESGQAVQTGPEGWFRHADADTADLGARAIFGVDGGVNGPDTLTIFRAEVESAIPLGHLATPFNFSEDKLQLAKPFQGVLRKGDIVALVDGELAALAEVGGPSSIDQGALLDKSQEVTIILGGRFTPPGTAPASINFHTGIAVYNLRDVAFVTYYLENNLLMADYHDPSLNPGSEVPGRTAVASNIDDFQVFYFFDGEDVGFSCTPPATCRPIDSDPGISSGALDVRSPGFKRVKAVGLGLMARSPREDRNARPAPRPGLFNRAPGSVNDRFMRNVMTEIIYLRNF